MSFRTRKRGRGGQVGSRFPTGDVEPSVREQLSRERFLESLMRDSSSHDINATVERFVKEGRQMRGEFQEAKRESALAEGKMAASRKVIEVLEQMKASGRTRIGDSELRLLLRNVLQELKLPATIFEED